MDDAVEAMITPHLSRLDPPEVPLADPRVDQIAMVPPTMFHYLIKLSFPGQQDKN